MPRTVYAVVLAAGCSTRFGRSKQLFEIDGQPLVARACELARRVCGAHSLLLVGHDHEAVTAAAKHDFFAINPAYQDGIGTSIARAAELLSDKADALLILLADQPFIRPAHLEAMLARAEVEPDAVITSTFDGTSGPPVLFPAAAFDALRRLRGDRGAREVVESGVHPVVGLPCPDAARDIDTPEDAERAGTGSTQIL